MMKARIIAVQVIPQIVVDDGVDLLPQQVQPMTVLWRDWQPFAAHGLEDALSKLQAQIDAQTQPPAPDEATGGGAIVS
jgi:hypothetical protein